MFINDHIIPYQAAIKTALDFGCGNNPVLAALLKDKGFETDIHDKFFAPDEVYRGKKYDLITATEVLEHLTDPIVTLQLLRSLLNENGILAIMTLFHPNDEKQFIQWWYRRDQTHISFYTPNTFNYLAKILDMKQVGGDNINVCVLQIL